MPWARTVRIALLVALSLLVHPVGFEPGASALLQGDQSARPVRSVQWVSLIPTDGVRAEPIPVEVDSYNALFYRWSPTGQQLVFGKTHDLFLYDAGTAKTLALTNTPDRWEMKPSWSPGGDAIAFLSRPLAPREGRPSKPGGSPWVMQGCDCGSPAVAKSDGTGYRVLETATATNPPAWRPDGSLLAYDSSGEIHLYNLASNQVTILRPGDFGLNAKYLSAPSWSPTRQELAVFFSADARSPSRAEILSRTAPAPRQGYAILDLVQKQARVVYEYKAPFVSRGPALWSSDGERVALVFTAALIIHEPTGLVVVDRSAAKVETLAPHPYAAAWEPGGERLAFIDADNSQLYVLSPTKPGWSTQAIRSDGYVQGMAWRPIGSNVKHLRDSICTPAWYHGDRGYSEVLAWRSTTLKRS